MKKLPLFLLGFSLAFGLSFSLKSLSADALEESISIEEQQSRLPKLKTESMKLGAFSISLNVKDLKTSREFYENLGFEVLGGAMERNYLIMKNENSLIGLFQGMFEGNILTFNPGWDESGKNTESFDDIRAIQQQLIENAVLKESAIDPKSSGPASLTIIDPDGNLILIDQHR